MNIRATDITHYVDVMLTLEEVALLQHYAARAQGPAVEVGTYQGGSAIALGSTCPFDVFSVDVHEDHEAASATGAFSYRASDRVEALANVESAGLADKVTLIHGESADVARDWSGDIGLLFLDGDPMQFAQDFEAWAGYVMAGGYVIAHNTPEPTVQDVLAGLDTGEWQWVRNQDRTAVYRRVGGDARPVTEYSTPKIVEPETETDEQPKPKRKRKAG